MRPEDIIIRPLITEKATELRDDQEHRRLRGQYARQQD